MYAETEKMLEEVKKLRATFTGQFNLEEVKKRIKEIELLEGDDETQHILEDKLYVDFIHYVAEYDVYEVFDFEIIKEIAKELLKVDAMQFSRWYA